MTMTVLRAARFVEDFTDDVLAALLVRTLSAAGLILLTLLAGCRPGEAPGLQRGCPRARHKSQPVKKAEVETAQLREDLAGAREEERKPAELAGTYAALIEQPAHERAEATAERDGAPAARDATLGVTALRTTPPQQRAAGARPRRPLPRGGR
ncbi:hypothetical protein [Streptomyces sp. NPDC001744]|uniref:hypothetical protein n=1 Tax=Streptomyces sp. NPDC001744 TaxID=3364606 RepID=UPI0036BA40EF